MPALPVAPELALEPLVGGHADAVLRHHDVRSVNGLSKYCVGMGMGMGMGGRARRESWPQAVCDAFAKSRPVATAGVEEPSNGPFPI